MRFVVILSSLFLFVSPLSAEHGNPAPAQNGPAFRKVMCDHECKMSYRQCYKVCGRKAEPYKTVCYGVCEAKLSRCNGRCTRVCKNGCRMEKKLCENKCRDTSCMYGCSQKHTRCVKLCEQPSPDLPKF